MTLNRLLRQKEAKLSPEGIKRIDDSMQEFERVVFGSLKRYDPNHKNSMALSLRNEPETTKYRESLNRLRSFYKARLFIEEIFQENPEIKQFMTGYPDCMEFKFSDEFVNSWSRLLQFKSSGMKTVEAIETSDDMPFGTLLVEALKYCFSSPDSKYADGPGPLRTPHQICTFQKIMAFFLRLEIRHISQIRKLENDRQERLEKYRRQGIEKRIPCVPMYYAGPGRTEDNVNWVWSKSSINHRYYGKEFLVDAFQPHSCKFNFAYILHLCAEAEEKLNSDRESFGDNQEGWIERMELIEMAKSGIEVFKDDFEMQGVTGKRRGRSIRSIVKELVIKMLLALWKDKTEGEEVDSNEIDDQCDFEFIIRTWFDGFRSEKDPTKRTSEYRAANFMMENLKRLMKEHFTEKNIDVPDDQFPKLSSMPPMLDRDDMARIWGKLADLAQNAKFDERNRLYTKITSGHMLMVELLAKFAHGQLTSITNSLGIERMFKRLVMHCTGNRFPDIELINNEGITAALLSNRSKLEQVFDFLPSNERTDRLPGLLFNFYPVKRPNAKFELKFKDVRSIDDQMIQVKLNSSA